MKKKITIKAGSLPKRIIHKQPDSELHKVLRHIAYSFMGIVAVVGSILLLGSGASVLHPLMLIAMLVVFSLATIDTLIRPGKGKVWLLTFGITPILFVFPLLIVIVPVLLLFVQYFKTYPPNRGQIRYDDLYGNW